MIVIAYRLFILPLIVCIIVFLVFFHIEPLRKYGFTWWIYFIVIAVTSTLMLQYYNYVLTLRVRGKPLDALRLFSWWRFILPPPQYYISHFEMLIEAEKLKEAWDTLTSLERGEKLPRWTLAHLRFVIAKHEKRYKQAAQALEEAMTLDVPHEMRPSMMGDLAMLYLEHIEERREAAMQMLEEALSQASQPMKPFLEGYIACGEVITGSHSKAIESLERVIEKLSAMEKSNPVAKVFIVKMYRYIGLAHKALDKKNEAREAFEKGLSLTGVKEFNEQLRNDIRSL